MLVSRLSCLAAVLLVGCAHRSAPGTTVPGADAGAERLVGAHAGRAPLLIVLRPGELMAGYAPLLPLLKAAEAPWELVRTMAGGDPGRVVDQMVAMLTMTDHGRGPTRLEGLDASRPLLLALFEPTVSSALVAALDPSAQTSAPFAARHRLVLPAADPGRLLAALDGLSPEPPAASGNIHVLSRAGLPAIAASPTADAVVLTWLEPNMVFGDTAESTRDPARRAALSKQAAAALLAPVPTEGDAGSASMQRLLAGKAAIAAALRPALARDAYLLAQATSVSRALTNVDVEHRAALLAKGTEDLLLSWIAADPEHTELGGLGVAVQLTPVLHLTISAPLTALGRRTMDAAFASGRADSSGCCSLPVIDGALLSAAAELDTGNYTRGIPALLPRGESPSSLDETALLLALLTRPAAALREVQIELRGHAVLPHAAAMSLTGIGSPPHAQGELDVLMPPSGERRNELVSAIEGLSSVVKANGGKVAFASKRAAGDLTLATVTADLEPSARRDTTVVTGRLLRAEAQPAKLARLLRAAGLDDRDLLVVLEVAEHFERLRASLRVHDGVLAGELAAVPASRNLDEVPAFTPPASGPAANAAAASSSPRCLPVALMELRKVLGAVANVDPSMIGTMIRMARQEIAMQLTCAEQDPAAREVAHAVQRLLEHLAAAGKDSAAASSERRERRRQEQEQGQEEEP